MYGLKKILTAQGLSDDQQYRFLALLHAMHCFELPRLYKQLVKAGFAVNEIEKILQQMLNAKFAPSNQFDASQILNNLDTSDESLEQKTQRWLQAVWHGLVTNHHDSLIQAITDDTIKSFAPAPTLPTKKQYNTILVLDSESQSIYDGLDYVDTLFKKQRIQAGRILIPAHRSTLSVNQASFSSFEAQRRNTLETYLNFSTSELKNKTGEAIELSNHTLNNFLNQHFAKTDARHSESSTPHLGVYNFAFEMLSTKHILIVTTESHVAEHQQMANASTHPDHIEVIAIPLNKVLTAKDIVPLLTEKIGSPQSLPAATNQPPSPPAPQSQTPQNTIPDASSDPKQSTTAPESKPASSSQSTGGMVIFGVAAFGVFAVNNPELIKTGISLVTVAATAAMNAAKQSMS